MPHRPSTRRRLVAVAATLALVAAACGDDDSEDDGSATQPDVSTEPTAEVPVETEAPAPSDADASGGITVATGEPFPEERCEANQTAGTITFLTGFDFAAAASIVEVIVADANGYYDDVCLDVELLPSFSTANYPLVASGDAQFASGGSFSEVVAFADANDSDLIAVTVDAHTPIDTLIVTDGDVATLDDLRGSTVGVKGKLPTSIDVMLSNAGLVEGTDYDTVLLDGFDPIAHAAIKSIVGFSGWQSNEPGALDRASIEHQLFTPGEQGVPGSFGAIFTTRDFVADHPTAAEDFVRATVRGLADALADPDAAAQLAVDLINETGNPNFLSPEGEIFRWNIEVGLIEASTPEGTGYAIPDDVRLQEELDAAGEAGVFGDAEVPSAATRVGSDITAGIYDSAGQVIWPG